ncbi:hypothetical protein [uncultured Helicobacter sp.]|uniref:hypothetical protein n=1 Tax=uncultured Helicobacter sp. TaxID=175537 RepID=UPI0026248D06|nr:hypothetical protein [uncultured Helicobacter sp.]
MKYSVSIINKALKSLEKIQKSSHHDADSILTLIEILKENDGTHLLPNAKKLKGHKHKIAIDGELEIIE